ncbi:MAG: carbonic anhydrase [Hyphomicrobiaceae bacterium]
MSADSDREGVNLNVMDAVEGHARFKQHFERERDFFIDLATRTHKPRLLWIGCSDSRVVPARITSADPGELFEVRNIANVVPPESAGEESVAAAIEYALDRLGIDDIVVCGHTGCGGVAALSQGDTIEPDSHLGYWLEFTRRAHQLIAAAGVPEAERHVETVKAHIHFQIDNLMTYRLVQQRAEAGTIDVHGWLYVMEMGDLLAYDSVSGQWQPLAETIGPQPAERTRT